jgi:hypothetical protein
VICSSTGISAASLGGDTVHKQFAISQIGAGPPRGCLRLDTNRGKADIDAQVVICDEIGMLPARVFEAVEEEVRQLASGPDGNLKPRSGADVAWFAG